MHLRASLGLPKIMSNLKVFQYSGAPLLSFQSAADGGRPICNTAIPSSAGLLHGVAGSMCGEWGLAVSIADPTLSSRDAFFQP